VATLWRRDVGVVAAVFVGFLLTDRPGAAALTGLVGRLLPTAPPPVRFLTAGLLGELLVCGALGVLVATQGWWQRAGVATTWPRLADGLAELGWLALLLLLLRLVVVAKAPDLGGGLAVHAGVSRSGLPVLLGLGVVTMAVVAVAEELLFRGLELGLLLAAWGTRRRGVYAAAVVTSGLFGLAHLHGRLGGTLPRVCLVTAIGLVLAGVRLRTGSVWLGVVVHWLTDVATMLVVLATVSSWWQGLPPMRPSVALGVVLLVLVGFGVVLIERAWRSGACQPPQPTG